MATYGREEQHAGITSEQGTQYRTSEYGTEAGMATKGTGTAEGYGRVILTLKSAHNLLDKAWIGKADPYCEVRVADATISTHHVTGAGERATWDESFAFNNVSPDDMMEFHVYDHNRLRKDAHMGEGSISLRQVFESGQQDIRVPLSTRSGTRDAGEVWVSLRCEQGGAGAGREKVGYETGAATERKEMPSTMETHETRKTTAGEEVCGQEYFTKTEDRPVIHERVTYTKEHRPIEKEYVVETRPTGVTREMTEGRVTEHLGTEERIVAEAQPKGACD